MRFINNTPNTIYIEDIDRSVPYFEDNRQQEISIDDAKKSDGFRRMLARGGFEIIECGSSLFERNLNKKKKKGQKMLKFSKKKITNTENEDVENTNKEKIEVKIRGHFLAQGGYAKVNRNLATGLNKLGMKVGIDPVTRRHNQLSEDEILELQSVGSKVGKNAIIIESVIPTFGNMLHGKYTILYTTIEAETIPQQFIEIANMYREVWANSDFCKEVLVKHGFKKPVYVIPNSVDIDLYTKECKPYQFKPPLKDFVFISVFGWSYRKGYDVLLKAYLKAFSGDDNTSLLIVSRNHLGHGDNTVIKKEIAKYIEDYGGNNPPHIARCSKVIPEFEMPSIYKACDAFVLFSRGESFGLPYCESSLCDLPVIATNCSGHTMFLNKENSILIDIDNVVEMETGKMQVHYWDGQKFPALTSDKTIKDASDAMRFVYNNYKFAKSKNKKLKQYIIDNYNIDRISRLAEKRLKKIWGDIS